MPYSEFKMYTKKKYIMIKNNNAVIIIIECQKIVGVP